MFTDDLFYADDFAFPRRNTDGAWCTLGGLVQVLVISVQLFQARLQARGRWPGRRPDRRGKEVRLPAGVGVGLDGGDRLLGFRVDVDPAALGRKDGDRQDFERIGPAILVDDKNPVVAERADSFTRIVPVARADVLERRGEDVVEGFRG
jgi:hypothetical protein